MADRKACCIPQRAAAPTSQPRYAVADMQPAEQNLVSLEGGWFQMGANDGPHPQDGEGPVRDVFVDAFAISMTTVTNGDFAGFVHATGYETTAERIGSSFVFHAYIESGTETKPARQAPWWHEVRGACWNRPYGPTSNLEDLSDHPVTHVSLENAHSYCAWAGMRLPTEAEWEFAARGGLQGAPFPWGDELCPNGQHRCNIWQGDFPHRNCFDDGYGATAPARCYQPNGYGFYAMTGNVWEWTADRFTRLHSPQPTRNPVGPLNGTQFVAKGGSYLCHASYCLRYRTLSRQALSPHSTAGNLGFRVVAR